MSTSEDNTHVDDADASYSEPSSGDLLRQAREQQDMSLQEAAAKLHLHQRIIAALENDDAAQLPSSTYVRGYLRNYSRLLGLDTQQVLDAYDGYDHPPLELRPSLTAPVQASSSDRPVKAVTYLLTLGLVVLLLAWWQSRHLESGVTFDPATLKSETSATDRPDDTITDTTAPDINTSLGYPFRVIHHPDSPFLAHSGNNGTAQQSALPSATTLPEPVAVIEAGIEASPAEDSANQGATEAPTQLLEQLPEVVADEPGNVTRDTPITNIATTVNVGDDAGDSGKGLKLVLDANSWIEVYDAQGEQLYVGLAQAGDTIQISGLPPFEVLLGFAPGVDITYNGKNFDTVEYAQDGVARFQVGK